METLQKNGCPSHHRLTIGKKGLPTQERRFLPRERFTHFCKKGCLFLMAIASLLPRAVFESNNHRENAPNFTRKCIFSITKSARGRPRKGEVKEERYKRKKDRHRKPLVQIKLDENLYNQHKVPLIMHHLYIHPCYFQNFKDGARTFILCTKKIANAASAYYQKINQPLAIYPRKFTLISSPLYITEY